MTRDEFLERATRAEKLADLWDLMLAFCRDEGIGKVSYHHHGVDKAWGQKAGIKKPGELRRVGDDVVMSGDPTYHIIAHGFPREAVESYVNKRLYEIDPIPEIARRCAEPFLWSDASKLTKLMDDQIALLELRKAINPGEGVAIQVFGPNMRHGFVGMGFVDEQQKVSPAQLAEYQLSAQLLHLRACTMIEARNKPDVDLSPRELEVLNWMAKGKSKSVIADILHLSVHTVDTVVRRIFKKMGVADRTSAILKAVNSGIIPAMASTVT